MHISLNDFTATRLRAVLSEPFPRILLVILSFLLIGVGYQLYHYWGDATTVETTSEVIDVEMRIIQGQWQWEPETITVPSGARVAMAVTNEDSFAHGFAVSELGLDQRLPPNQTTEFDFVADIPPGEYEFFCSVFCGAGHFGQRGTLVVTEATTQTDTTAADEAAPSDNEADIPVRSRNDAIDELPYTETEDGVKEFELTVDEVMWDYGDGNPIYSWGYNQQLPGPDIRITEGDRVRITVTNNLPEATTVHWHGVDLEWEADGVPGMTQDPIGPGERYVYEFTATPAGTRFYHTHGSHHGDEAEQMDMGLAGGLIIDPAEDTMDEPDQDITWVLTERIQHGIFPIHGAVYPAVPPIEVSEGETVRIRMINAGSSTFHPMHLHGHQYRVVAVDGNPIPEAAQLTRNTQPVLPGETYDIEFVADNPGHWLFHCHELQHAAGGMIAEVHYEGFSVPDTMDHGSH